MGSKIGSFEQTYFLNGPLAYLILNHVSGADAIKTNFEMINVKKHRFINFEKNHNLPITKNNKI